MKTSITKAEQLQLVRLIALARYHDKFLTDIKESMCALLEHDDETGDVSDVIYGDRDIEWLLERGKVTVEA